MPLHYRSAIQLGLALILALPTQAQSTQRVSLNALGNEAGYASEQGVVSAEGRYVSFVSWAKNVVPGVDNGKRQIYLHGRGAGTVVCASRSPSGQGGNGDSRFPRPSADGRWIAFESDATDLVAGDSNGFRDVFAYDRETNTLHLLSATPNGVSGDGDSTEAAISADGRYVAFSSQAKNLVRAPGGAGQIFRRNLLTNTTTIVSQVASPQISQCRAASLSDDGSLLTFWTWSDVLPGDHNQTADIVLVDLGSGASELVSVASNGRPGNGPSFNSRVSADGRFVAFDSYASTLVDGDTNGSIDAFLRDRAFGTTERVSVSSAGGQAAGGGEYASCSDDGRFVAFTSTSNDLVAGDMAGADVFVRDRAIAITSLVSIGNDGLQPQGGASSGLPTISADGSLVSFDSAGITPFVQEENGIFVRDLQGCSATRASYCTASRTSIPGCSAILRCKGTPSISLPTDFTFGCERVPGGGVAVGWFGPTGSQRTLLGSQGGLLCVAPPFERTPEKQVGGTTGACDGRVWFRFSDLLQFSSAIEAGTVVHVALWFRDYDSPDGFSVSDALWFQVCP